MTTPIILLADAVNEALVYEGYSSQRTYLPLVTPSESSMTVVVQPFSTQVELADRGEQKRTMLINVTVLQKNNYSDGSIADSIIEELHDIENLFVNKALGNYECTQSATSNPILSELMLANENALSGNILFTFRVDEDIE